MDWMLKDLAEGVPQTRQIVVLSADGLRMARYGTDPDTADRLAAACAGLQSLSGGRRRRIPAQRRADAAGRHRDRTAASST